MQILERLANGEIILIDGATGTEMERRGAPMSELGWTAISTLSHPDILRKIHEDYIRAGAEIIITNTFATAYHVMEGCGLADKFEAVNRLAAATALQARDNVADRPVAVAGSISSVRFAGALPEPSVAREQFERQAELLADAGVDLFMLEMMHDVDYTQAIVTACQNTGLPVLVGFSTEIDAAGHVLTFQGRPFSEVLGWLSPEHTPLISIMHTLTEHVADSLDILETNWPGYRGVYAHSGHFVNPNWQFIDVISPAEYAATARHWVERGVQLIGGCCGVGPEHIRELRATLPARLG